MRAGLFWRILRTHSGMEPNSTSVSVAREARTRGRRATWLVALALAVGCLAWLDVSSTYHGDEHFYFDAALRMWEGGSWWTPEYADGSLRLNKPLLSYWLSASSMQLLGPGLLAGRLPFVVAAVATLFATARLARALLPGESDAAALAPALLASCSTFATLSTRCTPDILLVLGVTLAWIGIAEWIVLGHSTATCARWIWGGCALAAAAKGSLALVTALLVLLAAWRWRRESLGLLVRSPATFFGCAIAVAAIGPVALRDAGVPGRSFVEDQVTAKIAASPLEWITAAANYVATLFRHLLPWSVVPLFLAVFARARLAHELATRRKAAMLAVAYALALVLVFSFSSMQRGRYLAPAYPALLVLLTPVAVHYDASRAARTLSRSLLVVLAIASASVALVWGGADLRVGLTCAALASALVGLAGWMPLASPTLAASLGLLLLQLVGAPAMRHAFRSTHVERAAEAARLDAVWGLDPSTTASLIRFESALRLTPAEWRGEPREEQLAQAEAVLTASTGAEFLRKRGWEIRPCGYLAIRPSLGLVFELAGARDPRAAFARACEPAFFATRSSGAAPGAERTSG